MRNCSDRWMLLEANQSEVAHCSVSQSKETGVLLIEPRKRCAVALMQHARLSSAEKCGSCMPKLHSRTSGT
ncbi:hypothetical protein PC116_g6990 [Phytophthora cactorum]|uniref:Uncharacterized protein n=1 Tax=Phytophthora cactorum TaxID=29920 RepID=A0A8T1F7G2_9STRA|nr:hypothetical protein PC111_g18413 [Phytophthora cactorum]KAG2824778.1 hypothetical protein PC112_g9963 [Phytophthora cactorum]KAG2860939.1 hypothetical protein PC113_g7626 [Phytophthora cactorum]KAG2893008.1 hypothetical protein PC115_g18618 [Phytophthora cactorum]KAG2915114.1 hypothetical protein PC114_g7927 [Phytophthora cactorum]